MREIGGVLVWDGKVEDGDVVVEGGYEIDLWGVSEFSVRVERRDGKSDKG